MKCRQTDICAFVCGSLFVYILLGRNESRVSGEPELQIQVAQPMDHFWAARESADVVRPATEKPQSHCTMEDCFEFSRCPVGRPRRVFVHNFTAVGESLPVSFVWNEILRYIRESDLYTEDPAKACLFVLGIDTTDRDRRSQNYVKDVNAYIKSLPETIWNEGRNHVIFNFYHGTFPDYSDHNLGFDTGEAIVARASPNVQNFRVGFDISFPLFHENHPYSVDEQHGDLKGLKNESFLVSFKGKRYVYGIGSGTRNLMHHLHNGKSMIMVTTCKHNNDWQVYQDERCQRDNEEYEKWDYDDLLRKSVFCLVPRGRRLASFRFLEALRASCIPVVVSDDWVLPYNEIIDWTRAAIILPENRALTLPEALMSISRNRVDALRRQTNLFYQKHLRSISVITKTAFEIIWRRLDLRFSAALE